MPFCHPTNGVDVMKETQSTIREIHPRTSSLPILQQILLCQLLTSVPTHRHTRIEYKHSTLSRAQQYITSMWPLKAAWCRLVRPDLSDTLTLVKQGMIYSAHLMALLAAATCSGVCQFLSRAFTSAWCCSNTSTVS